MKYEQLDAYQRAGRRVHAAMYLRKSRGEENMALEEVLARHRAALTAYAEQGGFLTKDTDVFEEIVSGESLFARPQMLRLLEAVSSGTYEAVLCMDMQRLGRGGMYDQGLILDTFKVSETLIATPERIYDLTKELDEEAAEMQTFLSRSEYRMITKRLRRGILQSVENGAYLANPPFGYRKTRIARLPSLEIVPEEAECIRQIFELYAAGLGCTKIECAVNAMGFHGRRNGRFNRNTIRLVLSNPVYIGKVRWDRTSTVKSGIGPDRRRTVVYNPADQWKIIDGRHPPIISPELWDAVQARRESRCFPVDQRRAANPLAGLVRCSRCGRLMNLQGKNKGVSYLLCPTKGCSAGVKFEFVEQALLHQLEALSAGLSIGLPEAPASDLTALEAAVSKAEAHLKRLDERRKRIYALLEDGAYSPVLFSERMQVLTQEEAHIRETVASLRQEIPAKQLNKRRLSQIETVLSLYRSSPVPVRKELLQSVILEIEYTKAKKSRPADFFLSVRLRDFSCDFL